MKNTGKAIIVISAVILFFTGCDFILGPDLPEPSAELRITNNSSDENIVINFGDYSTREALAVSQPVASGSNVMFDQVPLDQSINIWYTHVLGNTNYTTRLISSLTGDTFEFLFEDGESYELIINEDTFSFIHNGVDVNAPPQSQVASPEFNILGGNYSSPLEVELSTTESSGTIYYTLDNSDPTSSATRSVYVSPILLSETTTVRAVTRLSGEYSEEAIATYTITISSGINVDIRPEPNLLRTNESPILFLLTFDGEISDLSDADFDITNGTVSSLTTADNIVFSLHVTPIADGDVIVSLPADTVTNIDGASNSAETSTIEYDGTAPSVTISGPSESPYYYSLIDFEVLVDENTFSPLSSSDVNVVNGVVERINRDMDYSPGMRFIVQVIPSFQGDVSIEIVENTFEDNVGNGNTATASAVVPYIPLGEITELTASGDPQWVYGVDYTQHHLVKIDVNNERIDSLIDLPYTNPISIGFSQPDNSLYIAYAFNDQISRYNLGTSSFLSEFDFDSGAETRKTRQMEIAPVSRRIYVLTEGEDLFVIDMDNGNDIASGQADGTLLAITDSSGDILTGDEGISSATLKSWGISGSSITELSVQRDYGGNGQFLVTSPDEASLIYAMGGGNGTGYTMFDINPGNISAYAGEWNSGAYPRYAAFSPDDTYVYTYGDGLKIFNRSYVHVGTVPYDDSVNTSDKSLFTTNSDGTVLVIFSFDDYVDPHNHRLYFFGDIRP